MAFKIVSREAQAGDTRGTIYELGDKEQTVRAEVWPMFGFNCVRWAVKLQGDWRSVFYTAPDWETNPVATRSGHPILFPFPNRLKEGKFNFDGVDYQLPLNESTGKHAIHGFTPKTPWRVVGTEVGKDFASITGEFHLNVDRPDLIDLWPSDFVIVVTYTLRAKSLEVAVHVRNVGEKRMPFGLGYHPYFTLPSVPDVAVDEFVVHAQAQKLWVAEESLATGETIPVPAEVDFSKPKQIGALALDHLYGGLKVNGRTLAIMTHQDAKEQIRVEGDSYFRELLLFTPPHRRALAIEPYTCATDALNFAPQGINAGLRILDVKQEFAADVRYTIEPK